MDFPDRLWEWYGQDEFKRILAVCLAIPALDFLAATAEVQRYSIPSCPACETWSEKMLPVNEVLEVAGKSLPMDVRSALEKVWQLSNDLSEAAFHCGNQHMYIHEEWQPLRDAAAHALDLLGAKALAPHLDELILDCRNTIPGIKPKRC